MRWVAVLALGACNQLYGSSQVGTIDAQFFDAPIDAVPHCPQFGALPVFSPKLHALVDQPCNGYEVASDRDEAVATCETATSSAVFEGHIGQALAQIPNLPASTAEFTVSTPRLSPEGDLLVLSTFDITNTVSAFITFAYDGTSWVSGPDLALPQFGEISTLSRGPHRRVIYYGGSDTGEEYEQDPSGVMTPLRSVAVGRPNISHFIYLSPDALRLVIFEYAGVNIMSDTLYADRADRDSDFSAPQTITAIPPGEVFVTEDCTRVYVASVSEVFYATGE